MVDAPDLESGEKFRESSSLSIRIHGKKKNFETKVESIIIEKRKIQKKGNRIKNSMKYAIAQTSGKQFLVKPGEWYHVDLIKNVNLGDFFYFKKILFFRNEQKIQIGNPFLIPSQIPAKIIQQVKGPKITVLKTKPKKKYTRTRGCRQNYTRIQIDLMKGG